MNPKTVRKSTRAKTMKTRPVSHLNCGSCSCRFARAWDQAFCHLRTLLISITTLMIIP